MSLTELINRPCTLILRDDDFDEWRGEAPAQRVDTVCELQQTQRDEADDGGGHSETTWRMFFLPGVAELLSSVDAIAVDGDLYEVVGDPWLARNPRTREVTHVEATVKRSGGVDAEGS